MNDLMFTDEQRKEILRLAQAQVIINCRKENVDFPLDENGKVLVDPETLLEATERYKKKLKSGN